MSKKLTHEEFIQRVQNKSTDIIVLGTYQSQNIPIQCKCSICGYVWSTIPKRLMLGQGCPECSKIKSRLNKIKNKSSSFQERANKVHHNKYDYSKVIYTGASQKVEIVCPIYGSFFQTPNNHINCKQGCPKCSHPSYSKTTEEFLKQAIEVHKDKYEYSKCIYVDSSTPVLIICPIHRDFYQLPNNHLKGCGCPKCNESHGEKTVREYLETNNLNYISYYKIILANNKVAYVDFYLPEYNTFIEYNGKQHYTPIKYFGGQIGYNKQVERDTLVRNYCLEHSITLIEIPYNKNISNYLNFLKNEIQKSNENNEKYKRIL